MTPNETRDFLSEMFSQIGERFDRVDERLKGIDGRLDRVDTRFDQLEQKVDRRFEELTAVNNSLIDAVADINRRLG